MEVTKVILLHKKVDGALRPVIILVVLSKVTERIMCRQIQDHFNRYKILTVDQSRFRISNSCILALLNLADRIVRALGKMTAWILPNVYKLLIESRMNYY